MSEPVLIDGKPYHPAPSWRPPDLALIGREREIRLITAAFMDGHGRDGTDPPLNVHVVGPSGVGKTTLTAEVARRLDLELFVVQANDQMPAEDLAVTARPAEGSSERIEYVLSPLATAMLRGGLCLIDEISRLRQRSLAMLAPVADDRRTLYSTLAGFALRAHPRFRLLATSNDADNDSNLGLPEFMAERLSVTIRMAPAGRDELAEIVRRRFEGTSRRTERFLGWFWEVWTQGGNERLPSPRQLIQACRLAYSLAGGSDGEPRLGRAHVEEAIPAIRG